MNFSYSVLRKVNNREIMAKLAVRLQGFFSKQKNQKILLFFKIYIACDKMKTRQKRKLNVFL